MPQELSKTLDDQAREEAYFAWERAGRPWLSKEDQDRMYYHALGQLQGFDDRRFGLRAGIDGNLLCLADPTEDHMALSPLEKITFQHVIYGAKTILGGHSTMARALIQPGELEAAIAHARPLFEAEDAAQKPLEPIAPEGYGVQQAKSDLYQILEVYNATVIDGRYIDHLATDPKSVAQKLGIKLGDSAAAAIESARSAVAQRFTDNVALPKKIVAIAIVVVIAIRAEAKPYEIVVDSSGLVKV